MKTIRLPDPFPRGRPAERPEWGSSAWAADSCLVEWSTLEREWLGEPLTEKVPFGAAGIRGLAIAMAWPVLSVLGLALMWGLFA